MFSNISLAFTDFIGSLGIPTSDSERAMITSNVSEILMYIYSFSSKTDTYVKGFTVIK